MVKRLWLIFILLTLCNGCCALSSEKNKGIRCQIIEGEVDLKASPINTRPDFNHFRFRATANFLQGDYMRMDGKNRIFNENYLRYIGQNFKRFEVLDWTEQMSHMISGPKYNNVSFRRPDEK